MHLCVKKSSTVPYTVYIFIPKHCLYHLTNPSRIGKILA